MQSCPVAARGRHESDQFKWRKFEFYDKTVECTVPSFPSTELFSLFLFLILVKGFQTPWSLQRLGGGFNSTQHHTSVLAWKQVNLFSCKRGSVFASAQWSAEKGQRCCDVCSTWCSGVPLKKDEHWFVVWEHLETPLIGSRLANKQDVNMQLMAVGSLGIEPEWIRTIWPLQWMSLNVEHLNLDGLRLLSSSKKNRGCFVP